MYNDELDDRDLFTVAKWIIVLVSLAIVATLMWGAVQPTILHQQAQANRNSYQNITSIQTQLGHDRTAYDRISSEIALVQDEPQFADIVTAKRAEQIHLVDEMRMLARQIPEGDVPPDITQFLKEHSP